MTPSASSWLVIVLALVAANLPFFNQRLLAVIPLRAPRKSLWLRLLECIALYFAVGLLAWWLEQRIGNVFPQGWELYAITGCLFLVFAFPGFVYQYLLRRD